VFIDGQLKHRPKRAGINGN